MIFKRKKVEKPKSQLGYALYRYDNIFNIDLKYIIKNIKLKKKLNNRKADILLKNAYYKLDDILEDISRENFKTDYRSDKIRDLLIDLIKKLKDFFEKSKSYDFIAEKIDNDIEIIGLNTITEVRQLLKKKMKEIESDYI
jgi:hypothetical protein